MTIESPSELITASTTAATLAGIYGMDLPPRDWSADAAKLLNILRPVILREVQDIFPTGYTSPDGTAAGWMAAGVASAWLGHDPHDLAQLVLDAVRPAIFKEVAAQLHGMCVEEGHGGDCSLVCERGNTVLLVEAWATKMEDDRA